MCVRVVKRRSKVWTEMLFGSVEMFVASVVIFVASIGGLHFGYML